METADELVQKKAESQRSPENTETQENKPVADKAEGGGKTAGPQQPTTGGEKKVNLPTAVYLFRSKDDRSTKVWQLPKGTEVIITPEDEEWVSVKTLDGKKGYVRKGMLTSANP